MSKEEYFRLGHQQNKTKNQKEKEKEGKRLRQMRISRYVRGGVKIQIM